MERVLTRIKILTAQFILEIFLIFDLVWPVSYNKNVGLILISIRKGVALITLSLGNLKPGMILAEPTYNFQGVLLLDAGAELSENNIRVLKSWGVSRVCIEGEGKKKQKGDIDAQNEIKKAIKKGLQNKFSDIPKDPVMIEIMRVAAKLLEERSFMEGGKDETG